MIGNRIWKMKKINAILNTVRKNLIVSIDSKIETFFCDNYEECYKIVYFYVYFFANYYLSDI